MFVLVVVVVVIVLAANERRRRGVRDGAVLDNERGRARSRGRRGVGGE